MDSRIEVVVVIIEIHSCRLWKIFICFVQIADITCHDSENTGGQRRMMQSNFLIKIIVSPNFFFGKQIIMQVHSEDCVCLFWHTVAHDKQWMIILIQPCSFFRWDFVFVPRFPHHKAIVHRINLTLLIVWEVHFFDDLTPKFQLLHREVQLLFQSLEIFLCMLL